MHRYKFWILVTCTSLLAIRKYPNTHSQSNYLICNAPPHPTFSDMSTVITFVKSFAVYISRLPSLPTRFYLEKQWTYEKECNLSKDFSFQVLGLERQLSLLPQGQEISLTQVTAGSVLCLVLIGSKYQRLSEEKFTTSNYEFKQRDSNYKSVMLS